MTQAGTGTPHQTALYLVRHGHVHNPQQVLYGRIPGFGLSDEGRAQAQAAARFLAGQPLAAIYASPQQRAQETAAAIAAEHPALKVITDGRLDEVFSPFDGTPLDVMAARDWDLYSDTHAPYEQPEDVLRRVLAFVAAIRRDHAGAHVAAITHGDPVVFSYMHFKGISGTPKQRFALMQHGIADEYPATASITKLQFDGADDTPRVNYHRPY